MAKGESVKKCVHIVAAVHFWFAIFYELNYVQLIEPYRSLIEESGAPLKGRSMFLTFLNMTVRCVTQNNNMLNQLKSVHKSASLLRIFHFIVIVQYAYAIYYDYFYVRFPMRSSTPAMLKPSFGGKFKFLTYWCLIVQALFFTICLINDFIGTNDVTMKKVPAIRKLKDYMFATFAFPLALTVGSTFWILMAIDRELVLPKAFDAFFPTWLNHIMHTNIVIFIVLEMFICIHHYPVRKRGVTGLSIFMIGYLVWVHIIKFFAGVWVYPVLDVLNLPQRLVFYVAVLSFCASLYFIGEFANNKIWSTQLAKQTKSTKSKKTK